jgi:hypothetical protein
MTEHSRRAAAFEADEYDRQLQAIRSRWLSRPVVDTDIAQYWLWSQDEESEKDARKDFKGLQNFEAQVQSLGWSRDRTTLFCKHIAQYEVDPSIERYLVIRREFPEIDIQVGRFGDYDFYDVVDEAEEHFVARGIDRELFSTCFREGSEPWVDALCLRVLELLIEREKGASPEPGFIERKRKAISDSSVSYLIFLLLKRQQVQLWSQPWKRLPGALVALIKHQLCKANPDLEQELSTLDKARWTAIFVGQQLDLHEPLSVRQLSKMAQIPIATAARWLKKEIFQNALQEAREWTSEGIEPLPCPPFRRFSPRTTSDNS